MGVDAGRCPMGQKNHCDTEMEKPGVRSFTNLYPHIVSNSMGQLPGEGKWGLKSPQDFPCGSAVQNLPANASDKGSIPDLGRFHMPWSNEAMAATTKPVL